MDSNHRHRYISAIRSILLWTTLFIGPIYTSSAVAESKIAVLYPQIRGPYRDVFTQIIAGINTEAKVTVVSYGLQEKPDKNKLQAWLQENDCGVVVALGRRALIISQDIVPSIPVVAGAVLSAPSAGVEKISGISLIPDPNLLFRRLRELAPAVERVMVVYNPKSGASLIRLARKAAGVHGLKLKAIKAESLQAAAKEYQRLFKTKQLDSAALWLLQDRSTIDGKLILPVILEQAWKQGFVVFTSNPSYVKRGAFFALYPDNVGMGKSLARRAERRLSRANVKGLGMTPLQDLLMAVNLRTAAHLGLRFSSKLQRDMDLVFPAQ